MRCLTNEEARRIAVRAQLLDGDRPTDLLKTVERLTMLQLDPTAAVAPSADLVAWSRLGNAYQPRDLQNAIEVDRSLFEHQAMVRPTADLGLYLAEMKEWPPYPRMREWVATNDAFRRRVIDRLRADGPLPSRAIEDACEVAWQSTGWTNDRNVTKMLELLAARGEIAISARVGRQRLWDVPERVYPRGVKALPAAKATQARHERRLRSLGVARPKVVGDAGVPVTIEGTKGEWRLDPDASADGFEGRTALLSPFDRLVHDRQRALDLFGYEYTLEMYKPQGQRRWGYYALPVLYGDRLVGKVDATADRKRKVLRVDAIHRDVPFTKAMTKAVDGELHALASWLGLGR